MMERARLRGLGTEIGAGICAVVVAGLAGGSYSARLSDHRGNHLVPVVDSVAAVNPDFRRPRHTVIVVADGLRADAARTMGSFAWLTKRGRCGTMDVGSLTRSRPIYVLLSAGVEADRTGVRTNDDRAKATVESLWQVGRRFGLRVNATSGLRWWRELFPEGFDDYQQPPETVDLFSTIRLADLSLIHPVYVDEAGHQAGAASAAYAAAVARLDREMLPFLERLDLSQDLVILTADHGHTARGGHGSPVSELREVSICLAGRGVQNTAVLAPPIDARSFPALVAVFEGLPFPKHLAAGHDSSADGLDRIFTLVDPATVSPSWLALRRRAVEVRRDANRAQLEAWLQGPPGTWARLARREEQRQLVRGSLTLIAGLAVLWWLARRRRCSSRAVAAALIWACAVAGTSYLATIVCRGSFDLAAIKSKESFLVVESCALLGVLCLAFLAHLALWRDLRRFLGDAQVLVGLQMVLLAAHLIAFGWPIGYPLPPPQLLFAPYPLVILTGGTGCFLLAATVMQLVLKRASPVNTAVE
jgi:hypothetical protein